MHQKFYIDTDEEISSVIDRLNKSMAVDNYFVIPKRAIFLQSIVNLKLLKREADKTGKNIIIVTQDEVGISMAHRSGINTRSSLDGLEVTPDQYAGNTAEDDYLENKKSISIKPKLVEEIPNQDKQVRLKNIGSDDFYNAHQVAEKKKSITKNAKSLPRRIPVNSTNIFSSSKGNIKKESSSAVSQRGTQQIQQHYEKIQSQRFDGPAITTGYNIYQKEREGLKRLDPHKERSLEKMFSSSRSSENRQSANPKKVRGKIKKIFYVFITLCLLAFAGVAAYLLVPSAKIILVPNILKNKIEANIHGASDGGTDATNIAVRVLDETQDISLTYEVTGKNSVSGKKASGSVVVYNEYSSSSQTLIATTRLQSTDGKIFRLLKNVVVPGTTNIGGTIQPGAIEAEVVADQAGSDFNIDPTDFKIPGFAGGPKFDKFYAKSSQSFSGGSSDGEDSGSVKVTQQDIDSAKAKAGSAINDKINSVISGELQTGEVALPQAEKITITKNTVNAKVGDMVSSFECTASASVRALVFSENDVKKILQQQASDSTDQSQKSKEEITKIEYGSVDPNFDNGALDLKINGEITITPDINTEQIKKSLLGKSSDQLGDILKNYSSIKNASVEFQPEFISRIPQYAQRVTVEVNNGG